VANLKTKNMSNKITTEKFDAIRFEKIKHLLESHGERGKARYFEIFVDNLKVVDKTNDIGSFDDYLLYLDDKTKMIKLLLYATCESSPRNDKFFFTFESAEEKNSLGALEVQDKIAMAINTERERQKTESLLEEVQLLNEELEEANETINTLYKQLEKEKTTKADDSKQVKLGAVASIAIEHLLKRNPNILSKIPLLGLLSGLDDNTNTDTEPISEHETKTSFTQTKFEEAGLEYEMMQVFNDAEFKQVIDIINLLGEHKNKITTTLELLK
jgi:hypothetical protein